MKQYLIGAAIGSSLTLAVAWISWVYVPAWNAGRLYESIPYDAEPYAKCEAAERTADAWAVAGSYERSRTWRDKAETQCAIARLNSLSR